MRAISGRLAFFIGVIVLAGSPAVAQRLGGADEAGISAVRIIAALVVCLAAAVALIFIVKARGGRRLAAIDFRALTNRSSRIKVVEVRRISSYAEISVIVCDGAEYVILSGPSGQQIIDRRDQAATAPGIGAVP
ncbi:MAG: hypothetical protein J0M19_11610 [Sphingomonadales bacterium]|nr:hypothetical protein [Sphingomonadales bacterium]